MDVRAEGPAVCLAQAERLGSRYQPPEKGQRPGHLCTMAFQTVGPLALSAFGLLRSQAFHLG